MKLGEMTGISGPAGMSVSGIGSAPVQVRQRRLMIVDEDPVSARALAATALAANVREPRRFGSVGPAVTHVDSGQVRAAIVEWRLGAGDALQVLVALQRHGVPAVVVARNVRSARRALHSARLAFRVLDKDRKGELAAWLRGLGE